MCKPNYHEEADLNEEVYYKPHPVVILYLKEKTYTKQQMTQIYKRIVKVFNTAGWKYVLGLHHDGPNKVEVVTMRDFDEIKFAELEKLVLDSLNLTD